MYRNRRRLGVLVFAAVILPLVACSITINVPGGTGGQVSQPQVNSAPATNSGTGADIEVPETSNTNPPGPGIGEPLSIPTPLVLVCELPEGWHSLKGLTGDALKAEYENRKWKVLPCEVVQGDINIVEGIKDPAETPPLQAGRQSDGVLIICNGFSVCLPVTEDQFNEFNDPNLNYQERWDKYGGDNLCSTLGLDKSLCASPK